MVKMQTPIYVTYLLGKVLLMLIHMHLLFFSKLCLINQSLNQMISYTLLCGNDTSLHGCSLKRYSDSA